VGVCHLGAGCHWLTDSHFLIANLEKSVVRRARAQAAQREAERLAAGREAAELKAQIAAAAKHGSGSYVHTPAAGDAAPTSATSSPAPAPVPALAPAPVPAPVPAAAPVAAQPPAPAPAVAAGATKKKFMLMLVKNDFVRDNKMFRLEAGSLDELIAHMMSTAAVADAGVEVELSLLPGAERLQSFEQLPTRGKVQLWPK
jgi:hypothetical protein